MGFVSTLCSFGIMRYFQEWNVVLLILGACSVTALGLFIERLITLRRSEIDTAALLITLRRVIREQNIIEASRICEETGGSVAGIVRAGIEKHARPREEIRAGMEVAGLSEVARLERNARVLSIIAHIAPLIGLLGTVLGFIQAFSEMRQTGLMDISTTRVGEAMEYALITTAAGLVVAIPAVCGYNYLVSRIENLVLEMQTSSSEVLDLLTLPHEL